MAAVVVLNGFLIIRPEELEPEVLGGLRLYLLAILACLVAYASGIRRELSWPRLARNPLLVLILVLLVAVVLSQLGQGRLDRAIADGSDFFKIVIYYLVLVAAITTRARLRVFFTTLLAFIGVQTTLAMAQYFGYIDNEAFNQFEQREYNENLSEVVARYMRLCGSGIYNDPNVLCLLLAIGMLLCLGRFLAGTGFLKVFWLIPFGYFGFALTLTRSRGGLLAVVAGLLTFVAARYGWKRALAIALLLVPVALVAVGGRQTQIDLSSREDSSQGRIQLWAMGLSEFPSSPVWGIGTGAYIERIGACAHNSFVQTFVELGILGGVAFLAAFVLAARVVATTRPSPALSPAAAADVARLRLIVLSILASYMTGMFSLSCNTIPPTYLILALATVYVRLAAPGGVGWFVMDSRMVYRVLRIGAAGFVFLTLFVKLFVRFD
jgi:O-antigen ligase